MERLTQNLKPWTTLFPWVSQHITANLSITMDQHCLPSTAQDNNNKTKINKGLLNASV